jgi:hypothetical protein
MVATAKSKGMSAVLFDLERLLAPVEAGVFFRDTWEKQPLALHRENHAFYAGLFTLADLDAVIAFTRPRFTDPGAFPGGPPPPRSYVQGWPPDW